MFENDDFNSSFSGGFLASQTPVLERKQNVRGRQAQAAPVTAAMILEMLPGQEHLRIGAQEFSCVTIVGRVQTVSRQGTAIFYDIDDGTSATIYVRQYLETQDDDVPAMENTYVRVIGALKTFDDKRSIMCHSIRNITDMNEYSVHLLEVAQCALFYKKDMVGALKERNMGGGTHGNSSVSFGQSSNIAGASGYGGGAASRPQTGRNVAASSSTTFSSGGKGGPQDEIYQFLKQSSSDEGVNVKAIMSRFSKIAPSQIKSYLEYLAGEGHIYTTIDDDHYKVTD